MLLHPWLLRDFTFKPRCFCACQTKGGTSLGCNIAIGSIVLVPTYLRPSIESMHGVVESVFEDSILEVSILGSGHIVFIGTADAEVFEWQTVTGKLKNDKKSEKVPGI